MGHVVLVVDKDKALELLEKNKNKVKISAFSGDITDDGRTIQIHFDYGDFLDVDLTEMLLAWMRENGVDV